MKRLFTRPLFWIIVLSLLPVLSLFHPGLPVTHDGQDHVARIANFYAALKEGIIVPRWAANLNWGYGHPILMFLYPLPEYVASAFHAVGFSLVDSTKLVMGLSFIASGITMFLFMNAAWGTTAGIIGALLYMFAPYRFVDFYVRGALGEHIAFVFPPLVMYFLLKKKWVGMSVSLAALILSHNAISLMFLPIIGAYGLHVFFGDKHKVSFAVSFTLFTLLGFGLSSFFWVPALLEGRFTLRDIVTAGEALTRFVNPVTFLYSPWNYGGTDTLTKALGFPQLFGLVAAIVTIIKTKQDKLRIILGVSAGLLLISLLLMTNLSAPVWRASRILQDFQFPWRFLSVSVFLLALIGGAALKSLNRKLLIAFGVLTVLLTVWMWHPKAYQTRDDSFYSGIYPSTTDTGESSPIWSVRFMEHTPANHMDVGEGDVTIREGKRTTTVHEYTIDVRKPSLLIENTLYFPGWKIYLNGIPTGIEWQNPTYRGLMTFRVTPGANQTVRVVFEDTKVRKAANMISLASIAVVGFILLWQLKKRYP